MYENIFIFEPISNFTILAVFALVFFTSGLLLSYFGAIFAGVHMYECVYETQIISVCVSVSVLLCLFTERSRTLVDSISELARVFAYIRKTQSAVIASLSDFSFCPQLQ